MSEIKSVSSRKLIVIPLIISLLVSVTGCSGKKPADTGNDSVLSSDLIETNDTTYKTKTLAYEDLTRSVEQDADPSYVFSKTVTSGSKEYILSELKATRNQTVKKGDVLAVLQGTGNESDVKELKLQIEYYKASCDETKAKLEAQVDEESKGPSSNSYEEQIRQLKVKKAQAAYEAYVQTSDYTLKTMMDQLDDAQAELGTKNICSPIDGIIKSVESNYKPGDTVKVNSILYEINAASAVLYYAANTSGDFTYNRDVSLKVGRGVKQATVQGRVVSSPEVMPKSIPASGIFVKVDPKNVPDAGHAEMTTQYVMMKNALIVDKSAVDTDEGITYVMLLDGNTVKKRYIVRGPSSGLTLAVIQGLNEGDQIILSSYNSQVTNNLKATKSPMASNFGQKKKKK